MTVKNINILNVKTKKSRIDNSRTECVKVSKYIDWVKKDLFGCFRIEEIRDKDNEPGLKEGGGIEIEIYSAFHIRDALALFRFEYLT